MRRGAILLMIFALASCTVRSSKPLLTRSDLPAEPVAGRFQLYGGLEAGEVAKVPEAIRKTCFDPGYSADGSETSGGPVTRMRLGYCPYDPGEGAPLPALAIERNGATFRGISDKGSAELRFRRLGEHLYFGQSEGRTDKPESYDYWVLRMKDGNIEVFPLFCHDFPTATRGPTELFCNAPSYEAIRPSLEAYLARIASGSAPLFILKPVR